VLGSLLGLGGGIVVVPALTLLLKIDIHYAIGASIVSVIATSSGAAAAYVRERMTNLRVAILLELATTPGALTGAFLAGIVGGRWLYIVFGSMLGYSALAMFRKRHDVPGTDVPPDRLADRLRLHGVYYDEATGYDVAYSRHPYPARPCADVHSRRRKRPAGHRVGRAQGSRPGPGHATSRSRSPRPPATS